MTTAMHAFNYLFELIGVWAMKACLSSRNRLAHNCVAEELWPSIRQIQSLSITESKLASPLEIGERKEGVRFQFRSRRFSLVLFKFHFFCAANKLN